MLKWWSGLLGGSQGWLCAKSHQRAPFRKHNITKWWLFTLCLSHVTLDPFIVHGLSLQLCYLPPPPLPSLLSRSGDGWDGLPFLRVDNANTWDVGKYACQVWCVNLLIIVILTCLECQKMRGKVGEGGYCKWLSFGCGGKEVFKGVSKLIYSCVPL